MDEALMKVAQYGIDMRQWFIDGDRSEKDIVEFKKKEYWQAVNAILEDNPKLVGLYTNPQMERAWVNTRTVWMKLKYKVEYNGSTEASIHEEGSQSLEGEEC